MKKSGIILAILGVASLSGFCIGTVYLFTSLRAQPETSSDFIVVPAQRNILVEVDAQDGRYEYRLSSDSPFDFYFIGSDALAPYKESGTLDGLPLLDQVENTTYHETFVQTGAHLDFALLFVNRKDISTSVKADLVFFAEPPFPGGPAGARIYPYLLPIGLVLLVVGVIVLFIARRNQSADSPTDETPEARDRGAR